MKFSAASQLALRLFSEGKTAALVAITLDLPARLVANISRFLAY